MRALFYSGLRTITLAIYFAICTRQILTRPLSAGTIGLSNDAYAKRKTAVHIRQCCRVPGPLDGGPAHPRRQRVRHHRQTGPRRHPSGAGSRRATATGRCTCGPPRHFAGQSGG